jgi:hypothetical protein
MLGRKVRLLMEQERHPFKVSTPHPDKTLPSDFTRDPSNFAFNLETRRQRDAWHETKSMSKETIVLASGEQSHLVSSERYEFQNGVSSQLHIFHCTESRNSIT